MRGSRDAHIYVHGLAVRVLDGGIIALDEDSLHELRCSEGQRPRPTMPTVRITPPRTCEAALAHPARANDRYVIFPGASVSPMAGGRNASDCSHL